MSNDVQLALVQCKVEPGNVRKNRQHMLNIATSIEKADIIVFPELSTSGYHLTKEKMRECAEERSYSKSVSMFWEYSQKTEKAVVFSFPEKMNSNVYITSAWLDAKENQLVFYRKSMLWGNEALIFTPGQRQYKPIDTRFGRIGILICYDLEFPEPARMLALNGAEIILCPSVWSTVAAKRWKLQTACRALDNQCYVAGVNRIGEGACGMTRWINPEGDIISSLSTSEENVLYGSFNRSQLQDIRSRLPYLCDLPFDPPVSEVTPID